MRFSSILPLLGAMMFLSSCRTQMQSKADWQQPYYSYIGDGQATMDILRALDEGDIHKVRYAEMMRLLVGLGALASMDEHSQSDPLEKQDEVKLASDTLDYMLAHRDEFDPRLPNVKAGVRAMQEILTRSDDVRRLKELTDHYAEVEKRLQKP
jgi:hypothetical protein